MRKYICDDNFFEIIDTEEKAYWLGFLYADGNVSFSGKKSARTTLKLGTKDKPHIELFRECLKSNHPIKEVLNKIKYNNQISTCIENVICIYNLKLATCLVNNGCVVNKTFKLKYPNFIRCDLHNHFIRGYFDGDGCVSHNDTSLISSCSMIGTKEFLTEIGNILLQDGIKTALYEVGNVYQLQISLKNNGLISFRNFLYKGHSICLERKRNIFSKIEKKDIKELLRHKAIKRTKYKIIQYTLDMAFIKIWDCIGDIFTECNYDKKSIYMCCKNTRNTAYKYKWQFQKENL